MDDKTLRSGLIRLAHANPDMRPHLLPLLKEGMKVKKVPVSQRPPKEQVRYHVGTALSWLKAGAPEGANESLRKAIRIVESPGVFGNQTATLTRLITEAIRAIGGPSPRAGDEIVERILKLLPPKP